MKTRIAVLVATASVAALCLVAGGPSGATTAPGGEEIVSAHAGLPGEPRGDHNDV